MASAQLGQLGRVRRLVRVRVGVRVRVRVRVRARVRVRVRVRVSSASFGRVRRLRLVTLRRALLRVPRLRLRQPPRRLGQLVRVRVRVRVRANPNPKP